jgi:hypothetical protein
MGDAAVERGAEAEAMNTQVRGDSSHLLVSFLRWRMTEEVLSNELSPNRH